MHEEIIDMAKRAGIKRDTAEYHKDELVAFAKLAIAKENESCALLAERLIAEEYYDVATEIRARIKND